MWLAEANNINIFKKKPDNIAFYVKFKRFSCFLVVYVN